MDEITKDESGAKEAILDIETAEREGDTDHSAGDAADITTDSDKENGNNQEPVENDNPNEAENTVDYEALIEEDLATLKSEFPELASLGSITDLDNPIRYAALRDLGLSPGEAYLATAKRVKRDNRAHLTTAYGKNATPPASTMSQRELSEARELFGNLSDLEIQRLYKRVKERS